MFSKFKVQILELLKQYKFIASVDIIEEKGLKKTMVIHLKPVTDAINDIPNIKFFSKPSRAWYVRYKEINAVAGGK